MIRRDLLILNKLGLHARAGSHLVKVATGFAARITVERAGATADAKSIMGLMLLAAAKGSTVSVSINDLAGLSYAYNALVTDGDIGLLARNGQASFDMINVKTDDPAFAQPALPTLSISDASVGEGNNGTTTAFVTFTLSQLGMVRHWWSSRKKIGNWWKKIAVNGVGRPNRGAPRTVRMAPMLVESWKRTNLTMLS